MNFIAFINTLIPVNGVTIEKADTVKLISTNVWKINESETATMLPAHSCFYNTIVFLNSNLLTQKLELKRKESVLAELNASVPHFTKPRSVNLVRCITN